MVLFQLQIASSGIIHQFSIVQVSTGQPALTFSYSMVSYSYDLQSVVELQH